MLKPKVLGEVLSQANTGGVTNTLYVITWHAEEKAMLSQLKDMALTMQELCASLSHQVPPSTSRLLSPEGLVVAWSGEKGTAEKDAKVTSAIAFHIWQAYQSNTPQSFSANGPDVLLLNCEGGKLAIARVSKLILCMYADPSAEFGMLKAKILLLAKHLEEPLNAVFA